MRDVQVAQQAADITRAHHVIGVDESGDVVGSGSGPFTITAVRCPRESGERLAELLIKNDLHPWLSKSQGLRSNTSHKEHNQRVSSFIDDIAGSPINWQLAFGYSGETIHHKAAAVCVLAKKTITSDDGYQGDAILLPDGATSMYGDEQSHLRSQAAQFFDGPFETAFGSIYPSGLPKADLTFPEVTAADYISGYYRDVLANEEQNVNDLSERVQWFDSNWREPSDVSPAPFYQLQSTAGDYGAQELTRVAAWIKGRHPDGEDHDVSGQAQNTIEMLESETVQRYLYENILS